MTNTIAGIVLILLIIVCLVGLFWITFNVIRNEKRRMRYTSKMKIGDEVYKPITSGGITGEVLEINGDEVKMVITVNKSGLYPVKK
jgi:preprotein translocase subunit YajC